MRLFFAGLPGMAITHLKSLGGYAYLIQRAARAANLSVNWTPHSPRAGFVTWMFLHGLSREKIMTTTRHQSVRSFRVYLDAQAVVAGKLAQELLSRSHEVEHLTASLPHRLHAATSLHQHSETRFLVIVMVGFFIKNVFFRMRE